MAAHKRFFEKGDTVLKLEAYAAALHRDSLKTHCSFCFAKLSAVHNSRAVRTRVRCHRCGIIKYCDRDCRRKDSASHRLECRIIRRCTAVPSDFERLLIRVCGRYGSEKSEGTTFVQRVLDTDVFIGDGIAVPPEVVRRHRDESSFHDMISNWADLDKHEEVSLLLEQTVATSVHIFFLGDYIGWGVYPGLACLPHTCSRYDGYVNVFDGTDFVFRATKPFVLHSIDDIPVSMVHRAMSKYRREKILKDLGIECECGRCGTEDSAVVDEPDSQLENVLNADGNETDPRIKYACCLLLWRRFRNHSGSRFDKSRLLLELQSLCNKLQKPENSIMYASHISGFDEQVDYERSLLNLLHSAKSLGRRGEPDVLPLDVVSRKYEQLIADIYGGNARTLDLSGDLERTSSK